MRAIVRSALIVALTGMVLGLTSTARAEEKKADKANKQATGVIESVDAKAGTITIKHKKESKTFTVAAGAKLGSGENDKMTIADLKVGDKVTIHYSEDGDKLTAHRIGHVDEKKK